MRDLPCLFWRGSRLACSRLAIIDRSADMVEMVVKATKVNKCTENGGSNEQATRSFRRVNRTNSSPHWGRALDLPRDSKEEKRKKKGKSRLPAETAAYQPAANQRRCCQRSGNLTPLELPVALYSPSLLDITTSTGLTQHDAPTAFAQSAALAEAAFSQRHPRLVLVRPSSC